MNKHQVLSDNSQRAVKENFKSQDKLTNVSSAKSIRLDRAIKRMSVDPVPFFKVAQSREPHNEKAPSDLKTSEFRSSLAVPRPRQTRPYSCSSEAVKCSTLAHRRRAAEVTKSTVFVNGFVEPVVYRVKPSNNQGSIKVQDLLRRGEYSEAYERDPSEQVQDGRTLADSRQLGSPRDAAPGTTKHPHARTTTSLRRLGETHSKSQASAFKSPEAQD